MSTERCDRRIRAGGLGLPRAPDRFDAGPRGGDDRDPRSRPPRPGAARKPGRTGRAERGRGVGARRRARLRRDRRAERVPTCRWRAAALDAGLAVVVDKPLAPSADEAAALVEHARAAGKLLTVFQNRRWDSDQLTLRRLVSEGELGDVLRYESRFERWRPELREQAWRESAGAAEGGGVLLDLGSHLVDQALQLFGPAMHVYGEVDSRRGAAGDDDAFVALRHRAGTYSHLRAVGPRGGAGAAAARARHTGRVRGARSGRTGGRAASRAAAGRLKASGASSPRNAGDAWFEARRASPCRASVVPGRASTRDWSAPCGRAARRRSSPRTRSRRSACSRPPGAAPPSSK